MNANANYTCRIGGGVNGTEVWCVSIPAQGDDGRKGFRVIQKEEGRNIVWLQDGKGNNGECCDRAVS